MGVGEGWRAILSSGRAEGSQADVEAINRQDARISAAMEKSRTAGLLSPRGCGEGRGT